MLDELPRLLGITASCSIVEAHELEMRVKLINLC